jgi:hypothetical protein
MVLLRREVSDLFHEEFDKIDKLIGFSNSPKFG